MRLNYALCLVVIWLTLFSIATIGQVLPFDIEFDGNKEFTAKTLQQEFAKCPFQLARRDTDDEFRKTLDTCLRGTVFELYSSRGFFDVRKTADISVDKTDTKRTVTIKVKESEPTYFNTFILKRSTYLVTHANQLQEQFPLRKRERVNIAALRKYFNSIKTIYYNAGYLDFELDFDLETVEDGSGQKKIDITATLYEGGPFIISEVKFMRNSDYQQLSDVDLGNTLGLKVGQVYDESKLQAGLKRLNSKCKLCDLENNRLYDVFTMSSGFSRNLNIVEDFENRTVRIIIHIFEHPDFP